MEILILIAKIILMILEGVAARTATQIVAGSAGVAFEELWRNLPNRYK
jgi:hypothetical protein